MKPEIHPQYNVITATCSCGNTMQIGSTLSRRSALGRVFKLSPVLYRQAEDH
jgi:ribosomal protein L31